MKQIKILVLVFSLAVFGCKNDVKNNAETKEVNMPEKTIEKPQSARNELGKGKIILINSEEAEKLMQSKELQIVDVRTEEELKGGTIDGSVNMIYQENFEEKMQSLDKSQPVLVYCHSGRRSAECAKILQEAGFQKIYDLDGGVKQWIKDGKPLVH